MNPSYSISCRGKEASTDMGDYLKLNYPRFSMQFMDSVFGFTEESTLYGGRVFSYPEITDDDLLYLNDHAVGLKLPLSNHFVDEAEYEKNYLLLEKYHQEGNSVVVVNDDLCRWIRRDFPKYAIEASVIKGIDTHEDLADAFNLYDTVVLPMNMNNNGQFLSEIENKDGIRLFLTARCAYNCPLKICYKSISKINKNGDGVVFQCSKDILPRNDYGHVEFNEERYLDIGIHKFKILGIDYSPRTTMQDL